MSSLSEYTNIERKYEEILSKTPPEIYDLVKEVISSERLLSTLIENSNEAIMFIDSRGIIKYWNKGASKIFGYSAEEMIGKSYYSLIDQCKMSDTYFKLIIERFQDKRHLQSYIICGRNKDNEEIYLEMSNTAFTNEQGVIIGSSIIMRDITDRIKLWEKLQEKVSELTMLNEISNILTRAKNIDEILLCILIGATAGTSIGFNRAFLFIVSEDGKRLEGKLAIGPSNPEEAGRIWQEVEENKLGVKEIFESYQENNNHRDKVVNEIVKMLSFSTSEENNILIRCIKEGRSFNVKDALNLPDVPDQIKKHLGCKEFAVAPIVPKTKISGCILADNFITGKPIEEDDVRMLEMLANYASSALENAWLYEELQLKIRDLEIINRDFIENQKQLIRQERLSAIGEIAAEVAHELRNPLVSIGGFARTLKKHIRFRGKYKDYISIIISEISRLENIVTEMLKFSKISQVSLSEIDLNAIIQEVALTFSIDFKKHNINCKLDLHPDAKIIMGETGRLKQLLNNLIVNAIQAIHQPPGEITISTSIGENYIELKVKDNGIGIPEENLKRIFEPFFTTKPMGSGLGLPIIKQIVKELGGIIDVESKVNQGTAFIIKFPKPRLNCSVSTKQGIREKLVRNKIGGKSDEKKEKENINSR